MMGSTRRTHGKSQVSLCATSGAGGDRLPWIGPGGRAGRPEVPLDVAQHEEIADAKLTTEPSKRSDFLNAFGRVDADEVVRTQEMVAPGGSDGCSFEGGSRHQDAGFYLCVQAVVSRGLQTDSECRKRGRAW